MNKAQMADHISTRVKNDNQYMQVTIGTLLVYPYRFNTEHALFACMLTI
jgi:hypothetical protein